MMSNHSDEHSKSFNPFFADSHGTSMPTTSGGKRTDYLDAVEEDILGRYFGLRPQLEDVLLLEPEMPVDTPVHLESFENENNPQRARDARVGVRLTRSTDLAEQDFPGDIRLANAVARICLNAIQERLPDFVLLTEGGFVHARRRDARRRGVVELLPRLLFVINWADTAPGFCWPESYHVTYLPEYRRYVVTASVDSTESWGCTDMALGWFPQGEDRLNACRRIVTRWWNHRRRKHDQSQWAEVISSGDGSAEDAERWRFQCWGLDWEADAGAARFTLDEARLIKLRKRVGSFDGRFSERVRAVFEQAQDLGLEGMSLAKLLERAAPGDGADLDALEAALPGWAQEMERRDARAAERRETRLQPFQPLIAQVMAGWESEHRPSSGQAATVVARAKRNCVKKILESHLLAMGRPPTGAHRLVMPGFSGLGEVDFDELLRPAASLAGGEHELEHRRNPTPNGAGDEDEVVERVRKEFGLSSICTPFTCTCTNAKLKAFAERVREVREEERRGETKDP